MSLPTEGAPSHPARGSPVRRHLAATAGALRLTMSRPNMRRAQLSSAAAWTSEWAFVTALAVYAFEHGGAEAVGIVGFVRVLPAAVSLPFLSALADRMPRQRLLSIVCWVRGAATAAAAAAAIAGLPPAIVYALALVSTVAFTAFRPAHSALLPSLCTAPAELTSANAVRTLFDGISALAGPLAVAAVLEASSAQVAFLVTAVSAAYSAYLMALVRYEPPPLPPAKRQSVLLQIREGFSALAACSPAALIVGLGFAQALVRGALNVFAVIMAVELLAVGESWVGLLWAAVGAGGMLGALGTFGLVGSRRLGAYFGLGIALWGVPLAIAAFSSSPSLTLLLVAVIGAGNALVDLTAYTLFQRLLEDRVLGRVLGTGEMLWTIALALGSLLAPALVALLGNRGAFLTVGLSLPLLVVVGWRALRRIDAEVEVRDVEITLLREVPMLRPLPVPAIEHLASRARKVVVGPGDPIFREGEDGDFFYVIAAGEIALSARGGREWRLGPGGWFGEIALLRPVPRTASATAVTAAELRALDADAFVPAVSGFSASSVEAEAVVRERLPAGA